MFELTVNTKICVSVSMYRAMMNEDQLTQKAATGTTITFVGYLSEKVKLFSDFILD